MTWHSCTFGHLNTLHQCTLIYVSTYLPQVAIMYVPALAVGAMFPPMLLLLVLAILRKPFRCFLNASRACAEGVRVAQQLHHDPCVTTYPFMSTLSTLPSRATSKCGKIRLSSCSGSDNGIILNRNRLNVGEALKVVTTSHADAVEIQVLVGGGIP